MRKPQSTIEDAFRAVGVTSARDKILALCNAPALFFNLDNCSEDNLMTSFVTTWAGRFLTDELFPLRECPYSFGNEYSQLSCHIRNSVFEHPNINKRRDLAYAMREPSYLDALITGIVDTKNKWDALRKAQHETTCNLLVAETEFPLLKLDSDYRKFYEAKARNNS